MASDELSEVPKGIVLRRMTTEHYVKGKPGTMIEKTFKVEIRRRSGKIVEGEILAVDLDGKFFEVIYTDEGHPLIKAVSRKELEAENGPIEIEGEEAEKSSASIGQIGTSLINGIKRLFGVRN